jgi:hypothetical protein
LRRPAVRRRHREHRQPAASARIPLRFLSSVHLTSPAGCVLRRSAPLAPSPLDPALKRTSQLLRIVMGPPHTAIPLGDRRVVESGSHSFVPIPARSAPRLWTLAICSTNITSW